MSADSLSQHPSRAAAHFHSTRWSLIRLVGHSDAEEASSALNKLIELYWYPLYAFARRKGHQHDDAMDTVQGYLTHLIENDALETVLPEKGRFRSFLLASFTHFIANQRRAASAVRRGGAVITMSLSSADLQTRYDCEPVEYQTAESLFEKVWLEALLATVRQRLAAEYQAAEKSELFALLEPHMTRDTAALPHAVIGETVKLSSAAVTMSLYRMRRRFGELLREEIAATVANPAAVDEELSELLTIAARG